MINTLSQFVIKSIKITYFKKKCQRSIHPGLVFDIQKIFLLQNMWLNVLRETLVTSKTWSITMKGLKFYPTFELTG